MRVRRGLLFTFYVATFLFAGQSEIRAQDAITSPPDLQTNLSRALRNKKEQWFRRGRTLAGQSAAALRYRAYRQKLQMRGVALAKATVVAHATSPVTWTSLGPAPLASNASGTAAQDYNWV